MIVPTQPEHEPLSRGKAQRGFFHGKSSNFGGQVRNPLNPQNSTLFRSREEENCVMGTIRTLSRHPLPIVHALNCLQSFRSFLVQTTHLPQILKTRLPIFKSRFVDPPQSSTSSSYIPRRNRSSSPSPVPPAQAGSFRGRTRKRKLHLSDIVKAGDPVLHEPARDVQPEEIGSERIQKIIDDMVGVMRKAPGVGLAAPQIGLPLRIIVLEDTKEYISYTTKKQAKAQDRRPFDLLVIVNPKLEKKGNGSDA